MGEQRARRVGGAPPAIARQALAIFAVLGAFALLGLFFYLPLAGLVRQGVTSGGRFRLGPLFAVVRSPYLRHVMLFTVEQALASACLSVAIGFPMAYILSTFDFPGRRLLRSLTAVPFALPAITVALGFIMVFGNNGLVNRALQSLFGLSGPPLRILYSFQGIILAHAFYNAPIVARFVNAAWEGLPSTYEESARSLGVPRRRVFLDITLPMLVPSAASGAMLSFIYSFLSFPIVLILGGARFTTIEVEIYRRAIVETNYSGAAALATWELLVALLFTFVYLWIEHRYGRSTRPGRGRPTRPLFGGLDSAQRSIGAVCRAALLYGAVVFYLIFYLGPVLGVMLDSFSRLHAGRAVATLDWYREVLQPHYSSLIAASPLKSIENSIAFAFASMIISLAAGTVLATALTLRRFRGRTAIETLIMAPIGISPVALGFAYLWILAKPPLQLSGTAAAIIIVHSVLATPFVVRSLRPALGRVERRFGEAARSLGASIYRQMIDIVLPLTRTAVTTAAVFAFAVSFAETSATIMLTRPKLLTMPVAVYYLLSGRQFGAASAMGMLLIVVIALSFVLIDRLGARRRGGIDERG